MLKQSYDRDSIAKLITLKDVWKWSLWSDSSELEEKLNEFVQSIKARIGTVSPFEVYKHRGKNTYQASCAEDAIIFRNLDRYLRRIYKVKQSDRNKIIGQIKCLLEDSGDYKVLRLDIEKCYESINFDVLINKLSSKMILSPENIAIIRSIQQQCDLQGINGLPRGLCISPTLTELFLENIDKGLARYKGVIYVTRYVDDYFLVVEKYCADEVEEFVKNGLAEIGLNINTSSNKYYKNSSRKADFTYLGYHFEVASRKNKKNKVKVTISNEKLNRIKSKLALSFNSYRKFPIDTNQNSTFSLLKQRVNYMAVIKPIKQHDNGDLLGGIAFNYLHVTDNFKCLKVVDGFYHHLIDSSRYGLNNLQKDEMRKKSFYGYVNKGVKGCFTKRKVKQITGVWKDA